MNVNNFAIEAKQNLLKEIDSFIEKQDYQHLVTPLKNTQAVKLDLHKSLEEAIFQNPMLSSIEKSCVLIEKDLFQVSTKEEVAKVTEELASSNQHLYQYVQEQNIQEQKKEDEVSIQHIFGISDTTMLLLYKLGSYYLEQNQFEEAKNIMGMLLYLAPEISNFWAAVGVCFQKSQDMTTALEYFQNGSLVNEFQPSCPLYLAECYLALGDREKAEESLKEAELRINKLAPEKAKVWQEKLNQIK